MSYKVWLRDAVKMTLFGLTIGWVLSCPGHLNDYRDEINSGHPYKWETPEKKITKDIVIPRISDKY
jgi:hypothetical protein